MILLWVWCNMSCFLWVSSLVGVIFRLSGWLFVVALLVYFVNGALFEFVLSLTDWPRFKRTRSLSDAAKRRRLVCAARRYRRSGLQSDRVAYQALVRVLYRGRVADDYGRGLSRFVS